MNVINNNSNNHNHTHNTDQPAKNMMKENILEETESKSSSENMEAGSGGEDQHELLEANMDQRPAKKRYHRHTLHQIAEMERYKIISQLVILIMKSPSYSWVTSEFYFIFSNILLIISSSYNEHKDVIFFFLYGGMIQ